MRLLLAAFTLVLTIPVAACVSTNAVTLGASPIARPKLRPAQVAVYRTADRVPGRYEEVALLSSSGESGWTDEPAMVNSMRKKAGQLGANAVLLDNNREASAGAKIAGAIFSTGSERKGRAVAIYVYPAGVVSPAAREAVADALEPAAGPTTIVAAALGPPLSVPTADRSAGAVMQAPEYVAASSVVAPSVQRWPIRPDPGIVIDGQVATAIHVTMRELGRYGTPVAEVPILVIDSLGQRRALVTDAAGTLTTLLAPGRYRVVTTAPVVWHGLQYAWDVAVVVQPGLPIVDLTQESATSAVPVGAGPIAQPGAVRTAP